MVDLDDPIVRTNALVQAHPLSNVAFRYVNQMVAQERVSQPVEELGIWAGHALTAGYCLRRIQEDQTGRVTTVFPDDLPEDLDHAARHVAELIRTEGAEPFLLGTESELVSLLDRLIGSEIHRRVGDWREQVTQENYDEIAEYLAWWVIKGYALRTVEPSLSTD